MGSLLFKCPYEEYGYMGWMYEQTVVLCVLFRIRVGG